MPHVQVSRYNDRELRLHLVATVLALIDIDIALVSDSSIQGDLDQGVPPVALIIALDVMISLAFEVSVRPGVVSTEALAFTFTADDFIPDADFLPFTIEIADGRSVCAQLFLTQIKMASCREGQRTPVASEVEVQDIDFSAVQQQYGVYVLAGIVIAERQGWAWPRHIVAPRTLERSGWLEATIREYQPSCRFSLND